MEYPIDHRFIHPLTFMFNLNWFVCCLLLFLLSLFIKSEGREKRNEITSINFARIAEIFSFEWRTDLVVYLPEYLYRNRQ